MTTTHFIFKTLKWIFFLFLGILICSALAGFFIFNKYQAELPDIKQLQSIEYQIPLRIYSKDKILLAQFGKQRREPIEIEQVPQQLINAFLAAEDGNFYSHPGVDFKGLLRAAIQLARTGKKKQGGSTITMQVTRNFLLTKEKTYKRKIKEIILALQIEREYSKEKILELYLNKIYLGHRSYGIAAAGSTYYGKDLDQLELSQLAMLAGLPKAPSAYNPITDPQRALKRRNYVLRRMLELSFINQQEFEDTIKLPITASLHSSQLKNTAPYVAEMVRQQMFEQHGEKAYELGLSVYTTIDSTLQAVADNALQSAVHAYDHRHGYRSLPHINKAILEPTDFSTIGDIQSAHVVAINNNIVSAILLDDSQITIPFDNLSWAREFKSINYLGSKLKSANDIVKLNDIIKVRQRDDNSWELTQIPDAEAAFVAIDSNNGAILALSGGFDYFHNKYNRVTQSKRQPGSGFKPIIYTTALENGFTAASVINDAPVVVDEPMQEGEWRPQNYSKKFFGMTPLRTALRKSRNLISIRLLRELGINKVTDTALRFGFNKAQLPNSLSLALGSGHATPLKMATVFSVFSNGGFLVKPYFIDRIENHKGEILFEATPYLACSSCTSDQMSQTAYAPRIISPQISFLMNSLLRDVVQRGTATRAKVLNRNDLAGKTGTTNEQKDTWFNGFAGGIAASAWLGFDAAEPLGRNESGGKAALPIWIDFMKVALKNKPVQNLQPPEGITKAFVDPKTGLLAQLGINDGVWEYFSTDTVPTEYSPIEQQISDEEESFETEESLF